MKKLHNVNEGLKKFAHVNKKAFEQYNNFTKQRDQLLQRREDLDKSAQSIEELVEVLDQRKDEAIERTFKQVASNFEEVFEKLVPAGRGRLIIQRRIDQDEEDADEVDEAQQNSIDNYTGVSIKVSSDSWSRIVKRCKVSNRSFRCHSTPRLTKVFGYNNYQVVRSHWLLSQQCSPSKSVIQHLSTSLTRYVILFNLVPFNTTHTLLRSTQTLMLNTEQPSQR